MTFWRIEKEIPADLMVSRRFNPFGHPWAWSSDVVFNVGDVALRHASLISQFLLTDAVFLSVIKKWMTHEVNNTSRIKTLQAANTTCQLRSQARQFTISLMDWRDRFKERFAYLKATEELTQEKLAERLDVTQGTVGHWLKGRRSPETLDMYEKLADAIGLHPAWLLYGVGPEEKLSKETIETAKAIERMPSPQRAMIQAAVHAADEQEKQGLDPPLASGGG